MKKTELFDVCPICLRELSKKGDDFFIFYLDICISHYQRKSYRLLYDEITIDLSELTYLESMGYVKSCDNLEKPDVIFVVPKYRNAVDGPLYCCEKTKHFV